MLTTGSRTLPRLPESGASVASAAGDGLPFRCSRPGAGVQQPWPLLAGAPRPTARQQHLACGVVLGLDEELRERGMRGVRRGLDERHLAVRRDVDPPRTIAAILERQAAYLDRVVGHDADVESRRDVAVGALEMRDAGLVRRPVRARGRADGLVPRRPDAAVVAIAQIEEEALAVLGAIGGPRREREAADTRGAAAGAGHEEPIHRPGIDAGVLDDDVETPEVGHGVLSTR